MYNIVYELLFLGRQVQSEPGMIVGPIAWLFGVILNFMFTIAYAITPNGNNSLGLAIILLTLVAMAMMLPLNMKSQRSMIAMQKLNPEIEKIKAKYGNKTDNETKQKIAQETQALWSKHKVNPLGSCLPMLIQMPLFFGILYIMNQSYQYITVLNNEYILMAEAIMAVPDYLYTLMPLANPLVPDAWDVNGRALMPFYNSFIAGGMNSADAFYAAMGQLGTTDVIHLGVPESIARVLDRFTAAHWEALLYGGTIPGGPAIFANDVRMYAVEGLNPAYHGAILEVYGRLQNIEVFLGLSLKENSGWFPPGVIIPILAVITTMATSWLSQLVNKSKDQQQKTMSTVMMVVMPLFMGFITVGFPKGVGLYWIVSNLFRLVQQLIMNKKQGVPFRLPFVKKAEE